MARTLTLTIEPNTTIVLPSNATLSKSVGQSLTLNINNQSGGTLTVGSAGSASNFTVSSVPASVADGANDDTNLAILGSGTVVYTNSPTVRTTTVNVQAASGDGSGQMSERFRCPI